MSFYKVYQTVHKMLNKRGYIVPEIPSEDDFNKMNDYTLILQNKEGRRIFVFFPEEDNVGIKVLRTYKDIMENNQIYNSIIVIKESITPSANSHTDELRKDNYFIEIFYRKNLVFDITEHSLVPLHEVLNVQEKKEILEKYNVKEMQLPVIKLTDPIARYYGLKKKDVVRITRVSETAGKYICYRIAL